MSEYLTIQELSNRLKVARQTIYNWLSMNRLQFGVHYVKPSKRRLLFIWSAIENWLLQTGSTPSVPKEIGRAVHQVKKQESKIRI